MHVCDCVFEQVVGSYYIAAVNRRIRHAGDEVISTAIIEATCIIPDRAFSLAGVTSAAGVGWNEVTVVVMTTIQ